MTYSTLINQGDGFIYDSLISAAGAGYSNFTWPEPNVWVPVPFNLPVNNSPALENQYQYINEDGNWQPPIAGWWQLTGSMRCYSGFGDWYHYGAIFKNGTDSEKILEVGGFRCVSASYQRLVYMNGDSDYLQMAFNTDRPGESTRSFSQTQTLMNAVYVRP